ncbi:E2/UBC family protein [Protofrankia symbiont of Coriaria ruscifolia]|uniref:E2/UBC family protein n=1 Tax=Protofrankia symbiont of Coriaria ruscifolia TaxID=1306542 RepID=UPI0010410361|nr:E2/UBC family protein [Protofrankia symbiont of Coriaria ruscifolia]
MAKTIRINGIDVPVIADDLTGTELKQAGGIPSDRVLVRQGRDRNTIVPDGQRIRVADGEVFAHHARHSKAAQHTDAGSAIANTRHRRVRWEAAQLAGGYPGLHVADDDSWVVIPGFRLPAGWSPDRTTVLLVPPLTYPESAPDGFYLGSQLRRRNGGDLVSPGHYFQGHKNPYADLGYFWYCLEDPGHNWNAAYDSLITFVEAIRTYLGTAD